LTVVKPIVFGCRKEEMKSLSNIIAVILLLFGTAWVLAGLNLIGDTSLSGKDLYLAAGAVTAAGAIALFVATNRARSFPE
jgi:uncharacterized membrane protein YiaA